MDKLHRHHKNSPSASARAFTLMELLMAAAIGAVILAVAAKVLIGDVRSSSNQEAIQRLRDHWGRVNYFVDTEVREGLSVSLTAGSGGCASVTNPLLTITVPAPGTVSGISTIHYYNQNGDLWRCGPDIADNGSLIFDTITNVILVENTTLEVSITNSSNINYVLTMNSRAAGNGIEYAASSEARTASRSCDPTSGICY
ncbi:type II secretion system protein J [Synechococcus sp. CS-1328]|uniref:PulJ/GspJ family protein n=1 Tax=Synechococcus sp. CS-1328 TaxID=2847976 RepID=UPI00223BC82B|nr:prepilin-type N-terminal cleavage/methylation domain-containing protein [Synechococcus sp. CS-1328]MCT0224850.1 prepilin-type N-terminal cleavage/methylation domain-containing protein [Synechococcus sp. CS-1328]